MTKPHVFDEQLDETPSTRPMSRNLICTLAAVTTTLSFGCAMGRTQRAVTIVAGAGTMMVGAYLVSAVCAGEDSDGDGMDEFPDGALRCYSAVGAAAAAVFVAGAVVLVGAAVAPSAEQPSHSVPPVPNPMATGPTWTLPEVATDAETLRLAKQVRALASGGRCDAARVTLHAIQRRDEAYHAALTVRSWLDACR